MAREHTVVFGNFCAPEARRGLARKKKSELTSKVDSKLWIDQAQRLVPIQFMF